MSGGTGTREGERGAGAAGRDGERVALFLDVENLVHDERRHGDWDGAADVVAAVVSGAAAGGTLVAAVACCDPEVSRRLAIPLAEMGVRTFVHSGGPDGADLELVRRMRTELPASATRVVIASGDHIFAPEARRLRADGRRVEVVARACRLSAELYASANEARLLPSVPRSRAA